MTLKIGLNPKEAPEGYRAVTKASLHKDRGNLCRQCDWRPTCQCADTDFEAYGHRCMGYAREDGESVAFKHNDSI